MKTVILVVQVFLVLFLTYARSNDVVLDSNGRYRNILVVIDDNVDEDSGLVDKIKSSYREASRALRTATSTVGSFQKQFAFGTVHILLPKTWSNIPANNPTWEKDNRYLKYIKVVKSNDHIEDKFQTIQPFGCYEPGLFTYVTTDHIKNTDQVTIGKQIVKEFAHIRWGVLPEHNAKGSHFYIKNNRIIPITCSENQIRGIRRNSTGHECGKQDGSNDVPPGCRFIPLSNETTAKGSLLYAPQLDSINQFCSGDTNEAGLAHAKHAPTLHNTQCRGQSAQDVIGKHVDFTNGPKVEVNTDVNFRVVRELREIKMVLVFDISSSMGNSDRIGKLKIASKLLIDKLNVNIGIEIGMVVFTDGSTIIQNMIKVTSTSVKNQLKSKIDAITLGVYTCIPCGINNGLRLLGVNLNNPTDANRGYMVLFSDGANNRGSGIDDYTATRERLYKTSIITDAMSISQSAATEMTEIATRTNGRDLLITDSHSTAQISQILEELLKDKNLAQYSTPTGYSKESKQDLSLTAMLNVRRIEQLTSETKIQLTAFFTKQHHEMAAIKGAKLQAILYSSEGELSEILTLNDDGSGCDIEAGDGIYSTCILAEMLKKPLKYAVKVEATSPVELEAHTDKIDVMSVAEGSLRQPPGRVTTLEAKTDVKTRQIQLSWIAVGDQLDKGKASSYKVKITKNPKEFLQFEDGKTYEVSRTKQACERMSHIITANEITELTSGTYYIAVKTTSSLGQTSEASNIITVSLEDVDFSEDAVDGFQLTGQEIGLTVASAIMGVVILGTIIFAIYRHAVKKVPFSKMKSVDLV